MISRCNYTSKILDSKELWPSDCDAIEDAYFIAFFHRGYIVPKKHNTIKNYKRPIIMYSNFPYLITSWCLSLRISSPIYLKRPRKENTNRNKRKKYTKYVNRTRTIKGHSRYHSLWRPSQTTVRDINVWDTGLEWITNDFMSVKWTVVCEGSCNPTIRIHHWQSVVHEIHDP